MTPRSCRYEPCSGKSGLAISQSLPISSVKGCQVPFFGSTNFILKTLYLQAFFLILSVGGLCAMDVEEFQKPEVQSLAVLKYDADGVELRYPGSLFYDEGRDEILVVDSGKDQLVVYTPDFFPKLNVGKGRGLQKIHSCYVSQGQTYVLLGDAGSRKGGIIKQLNEAFLPVREIRFSGFTGAETFVPREMTLGQNGRFYIAGLDSPGLVVLESSGGFSHIIQPLEEVLGVKEKAKINSVVSDKAGRLYLLSEEMGKVYVYDQNENFLFQFGQKGGVQGKLSRPRGVAIDERNNRIYIVDFMRHAVSIYSLEGEFLSEFGGMGGERGWLYFPSDVTLDRLGRLWIADTFNQRVQVFEFGTTHSNKSTSHEDRNDQPSTPKAAAELPKISSEQVAEEKTASVESTELRDRTLRNVVKVWLDAWKNQDVKSYMSFYSKDFDGALYFSHYRESFFSKEALRGQEHRDSVRTVWEDFRRKRLTEPSHIDVSMEGVQIKPLRGEGEVLVTFHQVYRSDLFEDEGFKSLILRKEPQGWAIVEEHFSTIAACCLSGGCLAAPNVVNPAGEQDLPRMTYDSMYKSG